MKPGMKHGGGKASTNGDEFAASYRARYGDFPDAVSGFGSCIVQIRSDLVAINPADPLKAISQLLDSDIDSDDRRQTLERVGEILELCIRAFDSRDAQFFKQVASLANSPFAQEGSIDPEHGKFLNKVSAVGRPMSFNEMRSAMQCDVSDRTLRDWCKRYKIQWKKGSPGRPKNKPGN